MKQLNERIHQSIKNACLLRNNYPILSQFELLNDYFTKEEIEHFIKSEGGILPYLRLCKDLILPTERSTDLPNNFEKIIQNDDIEQLKEMINFDLFDPNLVIDSSNEIGCQIKISLIELSCRYNAKKCFNYLLQSNASMSRQSKARWAWGVIEYAISGKSLDLIKTIIEKGEMIGSEAFLVAGLLHENEILQWFIHNFSSIDPDFINEGLRGCVISNNIEGFLLLFNFGNNNNIHLKFKKYKGFEISSNKKFIWVSMLSRIF